MKLSKAFIERVKGADFIYRAYVFQYIPVKNDSVGFYKDLTIDMGYIETKEEYDELLEKILTTFPELNGLKKMFNGYELKLSKKIDKDSTIEIEFHSNEKSIFGEIIGCEIMKSTRTYQSYSCGVKQ